MRAYFYNMYTHHTILLCPNGNLHSSNSTKINYN